MATSAREALDALNKKYGVSNTTSTSVKGTSNTSRNATTNNTVTSGGGTRNSATSAMDRLREKYGTVETKENNGAEIGRYGRGNVDLYNRPVVRNSDGTVSTVEGASFNIDGYEYLLPTVWVKNGKPYKSNNDDEIRQHFKDTGEYLGKFKSINQANEYAYNLHLQQAKLYPSNKSYSNADNGKGNAYESTRFYNQSEPEDSTDTLSRVVKSSAYNTQSALQGIKAQLIKGQAELGSEDLAPTDAMIKEREQADIKSKEQYAKAIETAGKAENELNLAKEGKGKVAQFAIDLARGATDLLTDAAIGAVTGGVGGVASLGTRAFGNAMVQAMNENPNADWESVGTYGASVAAVEMATEKLFGAAFKGIYGVGALDNIVSKVMSKVGNSPKGVKMFLTIAKDFASEGTEEAISDVINPMLQSIYNDKTIPENYKDLKAADVLYDFLVGGTLGALGSGTQLIGSANATNRTNVETTQNEPSAISGEIPTTNVAEQNNAPQSVTEPTNSTVENLVNTVKQGGNVSNNMAERVMADANAMAELGIDTAGKTKSQIRSEIKAAINTKATLVTPEKTTTNDVNIKSNEAKITPENVNNPINAESSTGAAQESFTMPKKSETRVSQQVETTEFLTDERARALELSDENLNAQLEDLQIKLSKAQTDAEKEKIQLEINAVNKKLYEIQQKYYEHFKYKSRPAANAIKTAREELYFDVTNEETGTTETKFIKDIYPEVYEDIVTELKAKDAWTANDMDMAKMIERELQKRKLNGEVSLEEFVEFMELFGKHKTETAQALQALSKYSNSENEYGAITALEAWHVLEESDLDEETKNEVFDKILQFNEEITEIAESNPEVSEETTNDNNSTASNSTNANNNGVGNANVGTANNASGNTNNTTGTNSGNATNTATNGNATNNNTAKSKRGNKNKTNKANVVPSNSNQQLIDIIINVSNLRGTLNNVFGKHNAKLEANTRANLAAMSRSDLIQFAYNASAALVYDANKTDIGRKIKTVQVLNMLSSPRTAARNVLGNATFYGVDAISMKTADLIDLVVAKATGTQSLAMEKSALSKSTRNAVVRGIQYSLAEITLDVDMGASKRYDQNTSRTFKSDKGFFENVASKLERNSAYALVTTDEAFKSAARSIETEIQAKIDAGKIKTTDPEYAKKQAQKLALERTFQNNSTISRAIQGIHDIFNLKGFGDSGRTIFGGKVAQFGLGDIVAPFTKVAGNLVNVSIMYSPANAIKGTYEIVRCVSDRIFGKTNKQNNELAKLKATLNVTTDNAKRVALQKQIDKVESQINARVERQAQGVTDLARGMNGTLIAYAAMFLAKSGVFKRADDEQDDDVKNLNQTEGMYGLQLNIDAFERLVNGGNTDWQSGDTLVDFSALEPLNFIFSLGFELADDSAEKENNIFSQVGEDMIKSFSNSSSELPIVSNAADFFKDTMIYKKDVGSSLAQAAGKTVVSSITPNIVAGFAKGIDEKSRSTTSGETTTDILVDTFKSRIPKMRETLPTKTNSLGEEQKVAGNDVQRFLNAVINPLGVNEYNQSDISKEMERVREATGKATFYPTSKVQSEMSYTDDDKVKHTVTLDYDQKQKYKQVRGSTQVNISTSMVGNARYKSSNAETQAQLLDVCYNYAQQVARGYVLGENAMNSWVKNSQNAQKDLGISQTDYLYYYNKFGKDDVNGNIMVGLTYEKTCRMVNAGMTLDEYADMNAAMKAIDNVKKQDVVNYLNSTGKTKAEKRALFTAWNSKWKNPF